MGAWIPERNRCSRDGFLKPRAIAADALITRVIIFRSLSSTWLAMQFDTYKLLGPINTKFAPTANFSALDQSIDLSTLEVAIYSIINRYVGIFTRVATVALVTT
jgi:hypothetical protein